MRAAAARWVLPPEMAADLSVVDEVLALRGHTMAQLLDPVIDDPNGIHDMTKGADILAAGIADGRGFGVFGDYDADGVTSAAAMTRALRSAGVKVVPYVPSRALGYGVSDVGFKRLRDAGAEIVVVVDSGTNGRAAIDAGKRMGLTIVVLDHHPVDPTHVAAPHALVNPQVAGSLGAFAHTSGAGVVYQMCRVLAERGVIDLHPGLSALAAVGIVADVMPLVGVNRAVVREGLTNLQAVPGLAALARKARLTRVTAEDVAFDIGPRLNAAGRMSDPRASLALLLVNDAGEAAQLASHLDGLNAERRQAQTRCENLAHQLLRDVDDDSRAIVVYSEDIPAGIAGPVASRLAERYQRPAFVGFVDAVAGVVRGSARSGGGVSPLAVLEHAKTHLGSVEGGGHEAAAGFTVPIKDIDEFAMLLELKAQEFSAGSVPTRRLVADLLLPRLLTLAEEEALCAIGPWGRGFDAPVIASRNLMVVAKRQMSERYGELQVTDGLRRMAITAFEQLPQRPGDAVDVAYRVSEAKGMRLVGVKERVVDLASPSLPSPGAEVAI
ncbi:MAG: single-stranded-DNA-specific exonuclease RecJ [Candidatus Dormibacteria bacterium]